MRLRVDLYFPHMMEMIPNIIYRGIAAPLASSTPSWKVIGGLSGGGHSPGTAIKPP